MNSNLKHFVVLNSEEQQLVCKFFGIKKTETIKKVLLEMVKGNTVSIGEWKYKIEAWTDLHI